MLSVSITDFRNNLSEYLNRVNYGGVTIGVVDEKKGRVVAEVGPSKNGNDDIMKLLEETRGMLGSEEDEGRKALRKADVESLKKRVGL